MSTKRPGTSALNQKAGFLPWLDGTRLTGDFLRQIVSAPSLAESARLAAVVERQTRLIEYLLRAVEQLRSDR